MEALSSHGAYNNNKSVSSSSVLWELEQIVREILLLHGGDETNKNGLPSRPQQRRGSSISSSSSAAAASESSNVDHAEARSSSITATTTTKRPAGGHPPNKRKSPHYHHGLPPSEYGTVFFHNHLSRSSSNYNNSERREKEEEEENDEWERVMWDCASLLSNSSPYPSFVASSQDRANHHRHDHSRQGSATLGVEDDIQKEDNNKDDDTPKHQQHSSSPTTTTTTTTTTLIFEGNGALATPGTLADGGTGAGTAQHLACVLDSPLALAILLVMGVNVEARHTAFRRLAIHEAACADSPMCLGLLMEVGSRSYRELLLVREEDAVLHDDDVEDALVGCAAGENNLKSSPLPFVNTAAAAVSTLTAGLTTTFEDSIASKTGGLRRTRSSPQEKPGKKKGSLFSGLQKGKIACRKIATLKKNALLDDTREKDVTEATISFPVALKVMWKATQYLRSVKMNETEAARYILDCLKVSSKSMWTLALQCPHLPLARVTNEATTRTHSFPLASIPGLSAANQRFRSNNHRDMQSLFIKHNVDGHGNTPLHWAAFKDSVRAIDVLLSYNVDVNTRAQPSGWAPLHDAAYSDAFNAVARLIKAGASVDARSHSGATPLCFAAQEDAPNATRMLLEAGADPSMRCLGNSPGLFIRANNADNHQFHSRFSGYTPLHYCAHYNAVNAACVLLYESQRYHHHSAIELLEIPDLNEKLPIHVAVARGSSLVLREFLHGGARVATASYHPPISPRARSASRDVSASVAATSPMPIPRNNIVGDVARICPSIPSPQVITPVSSPILRAMIPAQPIISTKPWNCLSQTSIDACKHLIEEVEMNWTPTRHSLFCPTDRQAIIELLRVGKRLEQAGRGIFVDLWPRVLSFCGRGWFEPIDNDEGENISCQCSVAELENFVQFELDGTSSIL